MMMYLAFNSTRFVHRQQSTLLVCDLLRSNLHLNVAPLFFRNYGTSIEDSLNYINEKVFDVGDAICFDLIGDLCNYILKQSSALISSELCQIVLDVSLLPFKLSDANNILRCKLIETIQFCSQPLPPHPDLYFNLIVFSIILLDILNLLKTKFALLFLLEVHMLKCRPMSVLLVV